MSADPWVAAVGCFHRGVLGRASTVAAWTREPCCGEVDILDGWQIAVGAATAADTLRVRRALASVRGDLSIAETLARLTREPLPACSVLLSDGENLAGLAWGQPLSMLEIDRWEYALLAEPHPSARPLAPGTLVALESCGPTLFTLPYPQEIP